MYTKKNVGTVNTYIDECRKRFELKMFPKEKISFLSDCIEFTQGGIEDIELLVRICTSFRLYKRAYNYITKHYNNDGVKRGDVPTLRAVQSQINYAIKKEEALGMLIRGEDIRVIMEKTDVREVDILQMKRNLDPNKKSHTTNNNGEGR